MNDSLNNDVDNCINTIKKGGLILYPTDTVWGLGCDPLNPDAIRKIYQLKNRPDEKSLILLAEDERMIRKYIDHPHHFVFEYLSDTKKPTTVIYSNPIGLPKELVENNNSIAIRIPNDPFCISLLKKLGSPIVSTSANISGNPTPQIFSQIDDKIKSGVDYIVNYRQSDNNLSEPSSIIKILDDGKIQIIRN